MSGETVLINLPIGDVFDVNGTPRAMQYTTCMRGLAGDAVCVWGGGSGENKGKKAEEEDCLNLLFFPSEERKRKLSSPYKAVVLN